MTRIFFKKFTLLTTLVVVIIGLTSFGMRLPSLPGFASHSGKPKPRPRAVVVNQVKTCKDTIKKLNLLSQTPIPVRQLDVAPPVSFLHEAPGFIPASPSAVFGSVTPARAPPVDFC